MLTPHYRHAEVTLLLWDENGHIYLDVFDYFILFCFVCVLSVCILNVLTIKRRFFAFFCLLSFLRLLFCFLVVVGRADETDLGKSCNATILASTDFEALWSPDSRSPLMTPSSEPPNLFSIIPSLSRPVNVIQKHHYCTKTSLTLCVC